MPAADAWEEPDMLGHHLLMAGAVAERFFERHVGRPLGLRPREYVALVFIHDHPGVSPTQVARQYRVAPASVTAVLDQLAAKRLLERRKRSADGRSLELHLTRVGWEFAEYAMKLISEAGRGAFSIWSPAEKLLLAELLRMLPPSTLPTSKETSHEQTVGLLRAGPRVHRGVRVPGQARDPHRAVSAGRLDG